jgi:hypothetical protein
MGILSRIFARLRGRAGGGIAPADALAHLRAALASAGFREDAPDPDTAWRAFRAFAAVPVAVEDDALLFQCGVWSFTGRPMFHWNLTRQLTRDGRGDDDAMEQLSLTILYEPVPGLQDVETSLWSYDFADVDAWAAAVQALPEFAAAKAQPPAGCEISQEPV